MNGAKKQNKENKTLQRTNKKTLLVDVIIQHDLHNMPRILQKESEQLLLSQVVALIDDGLFDFQKNVGTPRIQARNGIVFHCCVREGFNIVIFIGFYNLLYMNKRMNE
jgi:hypothetical protein